MASHRRLYLYGAALLLVGGYQAFKGDFLETGLYALAGFAFGVNALTYEVALATYKKPLVVVSWILIFSTVIVFLYLLRVKY